MQKENRLKRYSLAVVCLVLVACTLFLAACGAPSSAQDPDEIATPPATEAPATPTPEPTSVPSPTPTPIMEGVMIKTADMTKEAKTGSETVPGVRSIASKEKVLVIEMAAGGINFHLVRYCQIEGYVPADAVEIVGAASQELIDGAPPKYKDTAEYELDGLTMKRVFLRQFPYHTSPRVEGCVEVSAYTRVAVTGVSGDYYKIKHKNYTGYAPKKDIVQYDPSLIPTPKPTPKPKTIKDKYEDAHRINEHVMGWIKLSGTNIDYPILYDPSGKYYYNNHDMYGKKTTRGSIYLYAQPTSKIISVTGHNSRQSKTMFHQLHTLQNKYKKDPARSRTFNIYFNTMNRTSWELFAFYETKANEPSSTRRYNSMSFNLKGEALQKWIDYQLKRSEADLGVKDVTPDNRFVVLVTCGDNHDSDDAESRLYMFLRGK